MKQFEPRLTRMVAGLRAPSATISADGNWVAFEPTQCGTATSEMDLYHRRCSAQLVGEGGRELERRVEN